VPDPNAEMRDGMIRVVELQIRSLADDLTAGRIDLATWQNAMRDELRSLHALEVIAGAGGDRGLITAESRMRLGLAMQEQYKYLSQFADEIATGDLSAAQIAARSVRYAQSTQTSYWSQVNGDYDLPAQPGEGTVCHCGCSWRIVENGDGSVDAYWERSLDDSCDICKEREQDWNPYHIEAPERMPA
jgi:hypothetical protein